MSCLIQADHMGTMSVCIISLKYFLLLKNSFIKVVAFTQLQLLELGDFNSDKILLLFSARNSHLKFITSRKKLLSVTESPRLSAHHFITNTSQETSTNPLTKD